MKKGWLIAGIVAIILIFLVKLDAYVLLTFKFFVNNFASGRSNFKVIAFLVYFAISSFFIYWHPKVSKKLNYKLIKKVFIGLLTLTFIIGVSSQLYFFNQYDLDKDGYYKTFSEGRFSSTQLFHIHTSKAVLTKVMDTMSSDLHYSYDGGKFYAKYMPSFFWIFNLFSIPILLILSFILLLDYMKKIKKKKYINVYLVIYIIATFSMIKNTLDGGFLNAEAIFWFIVLLVLLHLPKNLHEELRETILYGAFGITFFSIIYFAFGGSIIFIWVELIALIAFFLFIVFGLQVFFQKKWSLLLIIFLGYLFVVLSINVLYSETYLDYTVDFYNEISEDVPIGSKVYLFLPHGETCNSPLYTQNDFSVCTFETDRDTNMHKLLNTKSTIPQNYQPILVEGVNCISKEHTEEMKIILVEGKVPKSFETGLINVTTHHLEGNHYNVTVKYSDCLPNSVDAIHRTLNRYGMKAHVVIE